MKKNKFLSTKANLVLTIFITTIVVILLILILYKQGFLLKQTSSEPSFLYVQTAHSGSLSAEKADGKRTLVLNNVSPVTVYFSDRPDRITGHESTEAFIAEWRDDSDSFEVNPPNAALDIIGENSQSLVIIELMNAKYDAETKSLEYDVIILGDETDGSIPGSFGEAVLFIDSAWKDYHCNCEPSSGKKECKCRYKYTLGKSSTKEFRGYCSRDSTYPSGISVTGRKSATSCTIRIFEQLYATRSCTNWNPTSQDELNITVHCSKR